MKYAKYFLPLTFLFSLANLPVCLFTSCLFAYLQSSRRKSRPVNRRTGSRQRDWLERKVSGSFYFYLIFSPLTSSAVKVELKTTFTADKVSGEKT
jgi:hypothetical protein